MAAPSKATDKEIELLRKGAIKKNVKMPGLPDMVPAGIPWVRGSIKSYLKFGVPPIAAGDGGRIKTVERSVKSKYLRSRKINDSM